MFIVRLYAVEALEVFFVFQERHKKGEISEKSLGSCSVFIWNNPANMFPDQS